MQAYISDHSRLSNLLIPNMRKVTRVIPILKADKHASHQHVFIGIHGTTSTLSELSAKITNDHIRHFGFGQGLRYCGSRYRRPSSIQIRRPEFETES